MRELFTNKRRLAVAVIAAALVLFAAVFFMGRGGQALPEIEALPETGDIIEFGGYNWIVLDVQGDRALIITEEIIGQRAYHIRDTWDILTWESSDIRRYLNDDFYNRFTEQERRRIAETKVINDNYNPWFGEHGGNDTVDKIFLLSLDELVSYFGDSGQLANKNHPDNEWWGFHDQYSDDRIAYNASCVLRGWWLRSPGVNEDHITNIRDDGGVCVDGLHAGFTSGGVRPALWLYF